MSAKAGDLARRGLVAVCAAVFMATNLGLLSGCAFNPAPVSSRPQPPSQRVMHHVVGPGDTLYAIAWRYEKDVMALARSNGLSHPYHLVPGQRLSLDTSVVIPVEPPARRQAGSNTATKRHKPGADKKVKAVGKAETGKGHAITKVPLVKKPRSANTPSTKPHKLPVGEVRWRWPVKGAVSRQYDTSKVFKGINIQSTVGQNVRAAANGLVVYAGSGLRGYGKLIIIKHSDIYLSAYAQNSKLSVKEGDVVKAGGKISTVGGDANNPGRLYFELRKKGKPVDPMRLLPRQ